MIGHLRDLTMNRDGTQNITITVQADFRETFDTLKDQQLDIDIRKHRAKRSLDANSFCWALCNDIGKALKPPLPKEEVYRKAIREVGEYIPLPIKENEVEIFQSRWASKGIGWFAEVVDNSKLSGYKLVFAYYGTSTYDSKAMGILLDYLVDDAEQMRIPIPLGKREREALLVAWEKHHAR